MNETDNIFGANLKKLKEIHLISFKDISQLTKIPTQTLWRYEKGENVPTIYTANKIAKLFNVSLNDMLSCEAINITEIVNKKLNNYLDICSMCLSNNNNICKNIRCHTLLKIKKLRKILESAE